MLLGLADVLARLWRLLPARLRETALMGLMMLEGRGAPPAEGLRSLFRLQDRLDLVINERAMAYGGGEHPKHRLTRYHDFFVERIVPGERVLDVGCGYGAVARSIAGRVAGTTVMGVELDRPRLAQARSADNPPNLSFIEADARRELPPGPWDVVVLSNVWEHIEDRVGFLKDVVAASRALRVLIRVPLFERAWQMPMRRELGAEFRSDPTHFIEHTLDEFDAEVAAAGLSIAERVTLWGEIWADCRPLQEGAG